MLPGRDHGVAAVALLNQNAHSLNIVVEQEAGIIPDRYVSTTCGHICSRNVAHEQRFLDGFTRPCVPRFEPASLRCIPYALSGAGRSLPKYSWKIPSSLRAYNTATTNTMTITVPKFARS